MTEIRIHAVPKDFATRQRLQPNNPDVVQHNACLSPTDTIEGRKSQEHWQCNPLRRTDRGSGPQDENFSNGPIIISECSNLL